MSALPGLGTTLVRGRRWQKSPVTGESAKETVKTIACGNAGGYRCTRLLVCFLPMHSAHEAAGATGIRRSPRPLRGERFMHNSGASGRGAAKLCLKTATLCLKFESEATHCGLFPCEAGSP